MIFKDDIDLQTHLRNLGEVFVGLDRLNDSVSENDKTEISQLSIPDLPGFILLIAEVTYMDYDIR